MKDNAPKTENESKTAIFAAIIGNLLIAVTKFIASALTGSSAMLSEGIHSVVDTGNGLLMLYGIYKSGKPPDEIHPFGHGREIYFWSLMVAISIFAVGGGVSIYEGVSHLQQPVEISNPVWNYAVLGFSVVFEGISWFYGWKAFRKTRKGNSILKTIHVSKDPTSFTVLLEDSTALIGLIIAFLGVFLGHEFNLPFFDGIASVFIGLLLCLVALFLGYETKGLLIGEAVDKLTLHGIRRIAEAEPKVEKALKILTIYFGAKEVLLTLELQFAKDISAADLRVAIRRIERDVKAKYPDITRVYYEAESLSERELNARTES
ncbi:MAG: cation diffusion facilitator family transporter [Actinomycetota bacterium]